MSQRRSCAGLALVLLLATSSTARADVNDYVGKPVALVRLVVDGLDSADPGFMQILETVEGRPLSMAEVRESLAHLYSLGRFESVRVDASLTEAGVVLRYELSQIRLVSKIEFTGTGNVAGLDTGQLRRAITNRYGTSPQLGRAGDASAFLTETLRQRGYRQARVEPRAVGSEAGRAVLTFAVSPGPRTRIGTIDVVGVPPVSRAGLLRQFEIRAGDPYEPDVIAARLASYVEGRRRERYYEAAVTPVLSFNDDETVANLTLAVTVGPRVRVRFEGDSLPDEQRDELAPIEREGSVDEDLLEDSTRRIEEYLRGQGYRDAMAAFTRNAADGELLITFTVRKGPQYVVERVDVSGNAVKSRAEFDPRLRVRQGAPYSTASRDADKTTIELAYRVDGFRNVAVTFADEFGMPMAGGSQVPVVVRITIVEGVRTTVAATPISGNASVAAEVLVACAPGEPDRRTCPVLQRGMAYFEPQMRRDADAIALRYANLGFRTAIVEVRPEFTPDGSEATLAFAVQEGPRLVLDHVLISGNVRTSAETIEREIQLRPGDPLGLAAVLDAQRRIAALGLFRRVELTELRHNDETSRDLLITVEETASTTLSYGVGMEGRLRVVRSEESGGVASEEFEVAPRAFFDVGRRNLFGKNRSVNLSTGVSLYPKDFSGQVTTSATTIGGLALAEYRVQGTYREPRLFNTTSVGLLTGTIERQIRSSFSLSRRGIAATVARDLSGRVSVTGGYQLQRTELLDVNIDPTDQPLIDRAFTQVRLSSFLVSGSYNTRDDPIDPVTGEYLSLNAQLAARAIGSEIGFAKSSLIAQAFRTMPYFDRVVLAGNTRLGLATGFPRDVVVTDANGQTVVQAGVKDLPQAERFFAGGDTTVRGFALDRLGTADTIKDGFPIGGNALVIFNVELRMPLLSFLSGVAFLDTGNVYAQVSDIDLRKLRNAVGYGARVRTPIGPIRVDWGYKLSSQHGDLGGSNLYPWLAFGASAVFISFGQAF